MERMTSKEIRYVNFLKNIWMCIIQPRYVVIHKNNAIVKTQVMLMCKLNW